MLKTRLIKRTEMFNQIFKMFLIELRFSEITMCLNRLDCENYIYPDIPISNFPLIPFVKSIWENKKIDRVFEYKIYDNYITDILIINLNTNSKISINDFKRYKNVKDIEIYLYSGELDHRYNIYLKNTLELIKETELINVINGEIWIDMPFDWQGQK